MVMGGWGGDRAADAIPLHASASASLEPIEGQEGSPKPDACAAASVPMLYRPSEGRQSRSPSPDLERMRG
jgi:hypothetical protein